jgi:hypothetical protein
MEFRDVRWARRAFLYWDQVYTIVPAAMEKKLYQTELGRFRSVVGKLSGTLRQDYPSRDAFEQVILDIHSNEIQPAIEELRASLRGLRIRFKLEAFTVAAFSTATFLRMFGSLSKAGTIPLLAGAGVALSAQAVKFRLDKREQLAKNPFSYVLAAERTFGRS